MRGSSFTRLLLSGRGGYITPSGPVRCQTPGVIVQGSWGRDIERGGGQPTSRRFKGAERQRRPERASPGLLCLVREIPKCEADRARQPLPCPVQSPILVSLLSLLLRFLL